MMHDGYIKTAQARNGSFPKATIRLTTDRSDIALRKKLIVLFAAEPRHEAKISS